MKISVYKQILFPILLLLLFTPWSTQIDHFATNWFYHEGHFSKQPFYDFIYFYGLFPSWTVCALASLTFLMTFFIKSWRKWRKVSLYLMLTLSVGSGLIIHGVLKENWGRPRPRQVIEYGGQQPFRAYYEPQFNKQVYSAKSFVSGHASMGFYFFSVALLGNLFRRKWIYYAGLVSAWGIGGLLGLARVAQGGHFLSDVLVSALVMWFVALGLFYLLFKDECYERCD